MPNVRRARDYMQQYGLRAVIAASPTNVAYFTGFDCWLYQKYTEDMLLLGAPRERKETFAFLGQTGGPFLITDSYTSLFASESPDIELRCYGGEPPKISGKGASSTHASFFRKALASQKGTPVEALAAALEEQGVTSGKVAIEMASIRDETLNAMRKALPRVEFLDGGLVLALIRMVKTEAEVGLLTTAARINERALYKSLRLGKTGTPVSELSRRYMLEIAREGAVFDHYFYSPDGLWLSGAQGYRLRQGEYTIIDSGCTFQLYFGDMGTTLLVGKERPDVVKRYREVWEAIDEVADHTEAGMTPADVMGMFADLYRKKNIPNPDYQGHGIGLEPREYPIMGQGGPKTVGDDIASLSTEIPLEVGMVVSLETSIYEAGEGSYEVERTFTIGKSSLKELTTKKDRAIFVSGP